MQMSLDRSIPGVLRIHIKGEGGHADAAFHRWRHNLAVARRSRIDKLLVVLELSGEVISAEGLRQLIDKVRNLDSSGFRIAIVQMRHERQNQDELGVLLAMERGFDVHVFPDEPSALLWLRHGVP